MFISNAINSLYDTLTVKEKGREEIEDGLNSYDEDKSSTRYDNDIIYGEIDKIYEEIIDLFKKQSEVIYELNQFGFYPCENMIFDFEKEVGCVLFDNFNYIYNLSSEDSIINNYLDNLKEDVKKSGYFNDRLDQEKIEESDKLLIINDISKRYDILIKNRIKELIYSGSNIFNERIVDEVIDLYIRRYVKLLNIESCKYYFIRHNYYGYGLEFSFYNFDKIYYNESVREQLILNLNNRYFEIRYIISIISKESFYIIKEKKERLINLLNMVNEIGNKIINSFNKFIKFINNNNKDIIKIIISIINKDFKMMTNSSGAPSSQRSEMVSQFINESIESINDSISKNEKNPDDVYFLTYEDITNFQNFTEEGKELLTRILKDTNSYSLGRVSSNFIDTLCDSYNYSGLEDSLNEIKSDIRHNNLFLDTTYRYESIYKLIFKSASSDESRTLINLFNHYSKEDDRFNIINFENNLLMFEDLDIGYVVDNLINIVDIKEIDRLLRTRIAIFVDEENLSKRFSEINKILIELSIRDSSRKSFYSEIKKRITDEVYDKYTDMALSHRGNRNSNYKNFYQELDGTIKKRLKILGVNYLNTLYPLYPYRLDHVGWGSFLSEHLLEISKSKKLLGDSNIHGAKLSDIDFTLSLRQKVINKHGVEYGDNYKLLMEKALELGFEERYPNAELDRLSSKDIEELKMIYYVDRKYSPSISVYKKFKNKLNHKIDFNQPSDNEGKYYQVIPHDFYEDKDLTFEITEKDNPINVILGNITTCCQTIGGQAESCVIDGLSNPFAGFLLIRDKKGNVCGQCYIWQYSLNDKKNGRIKSIEEYEKSDLFNNFSDYYLVLDNLELSNKNTKKISKEKIINQLHNWSRYFKNKYRYKSILIGMGYSKINFNRFPDSSNESRLLLTNKMKTDIYYSDANSGSVRLAKFRNSLANLYSKIL